MIYAVIEYNGKEQLCCVDKIGRRAFLTEDFFKSDLKKLCISSNNIEEAPKTMADLIHSYDVLWADDMALFFGTNPELGIALDPEKGWAPLVRLDEVWSPIEKITERGLLE